MVDKLVASTASDLKLCDRQRDGISQTKQMYLIASSVTQQLRSQPRPIHCANWNRPPTPGLSGLFPEGILLGNGKLLKEDKCDR